MAVYDLNLTELLELSKTFPSLLKKANKKSLGKPAVCMLKKHFPSRTAADLGTVEYAGKMVQLKGKNGKEHEDGTEGEMFVKRYNCRKIIAAAKRLCECVCSN